MSAPTLAGLLESFFRRRLTEQRNVSPATVASYRDALRLLVRYVADGRSALRAPSRSRTSTATSSSTSSLSWSARVATSRRRATRG
jgi:hypothetical protein